MKRLFSIAVFLSVMFSTDLPFLSTTTAFAAGGPSSSYRYLKGIRTVNYEKLFDDAASKNRDMVAKRMTPADISTAQKLARECVRKEYKGC